MGERNTILAIAIFVFAAAATVLGVFGFRYKMQAEALEGRISVYQTDQRDKDGRPLGRIAAVNVLVDDPKEGLTAQTKALDEKVKNLKDKIDNPNEGLTAKAKDIQGLTGKNYQAVDEAHTARKAADGKRQEATKAASNNLGQAYGDLVATMEKLEKEIEDEEKKLKDELDKLLAEKSAEHGSADQALERISKLKGEIDILAAKLDRMRERRSRLDALQEDGAILSADPETNLAVVNLGRRQGVRPGMIFDVFEIKRDGEKVRKGKLRLRSVESQQSFAVVLAARSIPKVCPKCGWTTTDITHIFCTFCLGGEDEKEREAQRLGEGSTKDMITAPEFLNPVKKGDSVSSPFYMGRLKQKSFAFSIIGQTVDRSAQEIGMFLKENGCVLMNTLSLETDFAVVGVGPTVWQDVDRARKMGISVIRESELFDFFGRSGASPDAVPAEDGKR